MTTPKILLGQKVRDKVTGYEGIAMSRLVLEFSVDRIGVQAPMGIDGKVPDDHTFDETQLEVIDSNRVIEAAEPKIEMRVGDLCEDTLSGFTGRVVGYCFFLNGCARITLQPKVVKEGKLPEMKSFEYFQLKKLEDYVPAKEVEEKVTKQKNPRTRTGGPTSVTVTRPSIPKR